MKLSTHKYYLGVDVCKAKLDGYDPRSGQFHSFPNTPKGLRGFFEELAAGEGVLQLVCEPTGGYEKALIAEAHRRGIPVSAVNPRQVRDFARAKGQLAKTDAIDARTLSEYGSALEPAPQQPLSAVQEKLSAVVRRKDTLVRQLAREKNALEKVTDAFVKADLKVCIAHLERRIARCEAQLSELIEADAELRAKRDKLTEVKGIGVAAATVLIAEVPELGTISDKQAASLIGVAPLNRDSGKWRGQRTIHGGRSLVRRSLYMPALCAAHHNPILREFYQRLIARNKPHHVALTAVIRKIICLTNRILADPDFQPS